MARLAMPLQGLRSHPLHEIYRMDFATASRAGDGFTASPTNQPWVRAEASLWGTDDKNRVVIGRLGVASGRVTKLPILVCDRMDLVLVSRLGDRFTPDLNQPTKFRDDEQNMFWFI